VSLRKETPWSETQSQIFLKKNTSESAAGVLRERLQKVFNRADRQHRGYLKRDELLKAVLTNSDLATYVNIPLQVRAKPRKGRFETKIKFEAVIAEHFPKNRIDWEGFMAFCTMCKQLREKELEGVNMDPELDEILGTAPEVKQGGKAAQQARLAREMSSQKPHDTSGSAKEEGDKAAAVADKVRDPQGNRTRDTDAKASHEPSRDVSKIEREMANRKNMENMSAKVKDGGDGMVKVSKSPKESDAIEYLKLELEEDEDGFALHPDDMQVQEEIMAAIRDYQDLVSRREEQQEIFKQEAKERKKMMAALDETDPELERLYLERAEYEAREAGEARLKAIEDGKAQAEERREEEKRFRESCGKADQIFMKARQVQIAQTKFRLQNAKLTQKMLTNVVNSTSGRETPAVLAKKKNIPGVPQHWEFHIKSKHSQESVEHYKQKALQEETRSVMELEAKIRDAEGKHRKTLSTKDAASRLHHAIEKELGLPCGL